MKTLLTMTVLALSATTALAGVDPIPAPEIDALAGLATLGAVGAIATLVWERRRR